MTKPEADPTRGIVDFDTFVLYLVEYRAGIVATRPSRWHHILGHPNLPFTPPADDPKPEVSSYGSWQDTPKSIQDIVTLQYPAAALDEDKSIALRLSIPKGNLSITFKSPSVEHNFRAGLDDLDKFARIVIPSEGLVLVLRDNESMGPKGNWVITQRPANEAEIKYVNSNLYNLPFESFNDRVEAQMYRAIAKMVRASIEPERVSMQPATLQELHDIVKILEQGKEETTWGETLVE